MRPFSFKNVANYPPSFSRIWWTLPLGDHFCVMVFQGANQAASRGWRRRAVLGKDILKQWFVFNMHELQACSDVMIIANKDFPSCLHNFESIRVRNSLWKLGITIQPGMTKKKSFYKKVYWIRHTFEVESDSLLTKQ